MIWDYVRERKSRYLAYPWSYCFYQEESQGHKRDDLVRSVEDDIKQDSQDNDSKAVNQGKEIADAHPGEVF